MKIVYLANAGSVHFIRWYEYFIDRGHEVHLISGSTAFLDYRPEIPGLTIHYLPEFKTRNRVVSFNANMLKLPFILMRLRGLIEDIDPDVIHAHQVYPYGFWASLAGRRPFIMTPIGSDVVVMPEKYYAYRKITEYVLRKADLVTGDSLVLKGCCERYGLRTKFELIQNGVDLSKFTQKRDRIAVRQQLEIDEEIPVVFYARGFTPLYNVEVIIRSIPHVLRRIPSCLFILAHHFGELGDGLRKLVADLGLERYVRFTGLVQHGHMPLYHRAADISISIPQSDNSPSSVYESMACGVPTIISSLPWTQYAMRHLYNTFILDETSPERLAEAIEVVLQDVSLRARLIAGGVRTAEKHFSYHANMERMEGLMSALVRRNSTAAVTRAFSDVCM